MQADTTSETLAGRLSLTMKARGLSQRALADLVTTQSGDKLSQVAVQKITSGNTRHSKRLADIARALGVSADWLALGESLSVTDASRLEVASDTAGGRDNAESTEWTIRTGVVPVVGTAKLGDNGFFDEQGLSSGDASGFIRIASDDPLAYALRAVGDSMAPRIRHGEFVVVEPSRELVPSEECVVQLTDGRKMIKLYSNARGDAYRLESINHDHPPIHVLKADIVAIHYVAGIMKSARYFEP